MRPLVIGGSGALGEAVCRVLAADGTRVAFTYHLGADRAAALCAAFPGALALPLDVTDVPAIGRTVSEAAIALGGIDALIICAAIGVTDGGTAPRPTVAIDAIDEAAWDRMLSVNTRGAFFACRAVAKVMRGGGNIVLTGSIDGIKPAPSPVHYAASKGALQGLVLSLMKELGRDGIRVNLVAPGVMEGGLSRTLATETRAKYTKHCGLGRVARPSEVAQVIAWLARENTYLTGQTLVLDGAL